MSVSVIHYFGPYYMMRTWYSYLTNSHISISDKALCYLFTRSKTTAYPNAAEQFCIISTYLPTNTFCSHVYHFILICQLHCEQLFLTLTLPIRCQLAISCPKAYYSQGARSKAFLSQPVQLKSHGYELAHFVSDRKSILLKSHSRVCFSSPLFYSERLTTILGKAISSLFDVGKLHGRRLTSSPRHDGYT